MFKSHFERLRNSRIAQRPLLVGNLREMVLLEVVELLRLVCGNCEVRRSQWFESFGIEKGLFVVEHLKLRVNVTGGSETIIIVILGFG